MAVVLGLSFYFHDSAASLVKDGRIVAAVAEERLCRRKHTNEFPTLAVEYCLEEANLQSINEIDAIVFYEKPLLKFLRVIETMIATWPKSYATFVTKLPDYLKTKINIRKSILDRYPNYRGPILFTEHHLSHAASAFFPSPYNEAAIVTIDGVGEWETTCIGYGEEQRIHLDESIHFPHSVGLLYSALTAYLGFRVNDGEWKVMGLAPYGEPKYINQFHELLDIRNDGSFSLNMEYFSYHWSNKYPFRRKKWETLFGFPMRCPDEPIREEHEHLAHSGQAVVEEIICGIARHAKEKYQTENLVIAGGVGLNSVANWKIEQEKIFANVWIQPAAGDDGGALGAALYVSHHLYDDSRHPMQHAFLGPEFGDDDIEEFLTRHDIPYEKFSKADCIERAAQCIAEGEVIGWFHGRTEFGPRSLGNRSILGDATQLGMKDKINEKIKFREYFRPFAPAVPLESVHEYFDVKPGTALPFMLKIPQVRSEMKSRLPAITHEDGTGRVQTVSQKLNPDFHKLLHATKKRTGFPVLVNTSFNVRGEPIVCSPLDAYNCFANTGINRLFMGSFMISKKLSASDDTARGYSESDSLEASIGENFDKPGVSQGFPHDTLDGTVIDTHDPQKVLAFYKTLPFNYYANATESSLDLMRANRIREYPNLHKLFKSVDKLDVLDIGCGAGWFANSCGYYYPHRVLGVDFNSKAIDQARAVARFLEPSGDTSFTVDDVFSFKPARRFQVINSIGVLHHTRDCHAAIRRIISWLEPGDYLHLGLYHSYSRRPFLDYFQRMQNEGYSVEKMFEAFQRLDFGPQDQVHAYSWFRDQVLHPHETQHSYEEISSLLESKGMKIQSTSINNFKSLPSKTDLIKREKILQHQAEKRLAQRRYFPGFFTVLAMKTDS